MKKMILIPALLLALFSAFNLTAQATGSETPAFQEFLAQFPQATLPYSFEAADLQAQLEKPTAGRAKRLAWDFYQFLPELERSAQYSNMPVYPEPIAAFETGEYYAVLYNIARGASKKSKSFSITVYDKQGNYIGTNFVAGVNVNTLTTATISTTLEATVTEYSINWTNNVTENGTEGNTIKGLDSNGTQTLNLTAPGNPDQLEWSAAPMQNNTSDVAAAK